MQFCQALIIYYCYLLENIFFSVPLVIVGNKLDLQYTSRVVRYDEGQKLAEEWKADFIETSAKDNTVCLFFKGLNEIRWNHFLDIGDEDV